MTNDSRHEDDILEPTTEVVDGAEGTPAEDDSPQPEYTKATVISSTSDLDEDEEYDPNDGLETARRPWSSDRKRRFACFVAVVAAILVVAVLFAINVFGYKPNPASATTTASSSTTSTVLPSVGSANETAPVDTTKDPRTPATFVPFHKSNHVDKTWAELYEDVTTAKAQYYIDAVNNHADKTGFDWSDVQKWAKDPQLNGVTPLTIQVYGNFTDSEARAIVAQLVGKDQAALLKIFRHPVGILGNTRSVGFEKVGDFLDLRKMVRLSLCPIIYDKNGKAISVDGNSGIFADCFNIWWLVTPGQPGQPVHPGHPGTPPPGLTPKDASKDVGANPNVASWKKDGGQKHHVSGADGSKVSNGLQTDPAKDAAAAKAKADADAAALTAAHQAAIDAANSTGGGTVDDNQGHTSSGGVSW